MSIWRQVMITRAAYPHDPPPHTMISTSSGIVMMSRLEFFKCNCRSNLLFHTENNDLAPYDIISSYLKYSKSISISFTILHLQTPHTICLGVMERSFFIAMIGDRHCIGSRAVVLAFEEYVAAGLGSLPQGWVAAKGA